MSNENKEVIIMGDFNIDLMKTEDDNHINEFYNIIRTNFFVPHNSSHQNYIKLKNTH